MHVRWIGNRIDARCRLCAIFAGLALAGALPAAGQQAPVADTAALHRQDAIRAIRRRAPVRAQAGRAASPAYVEIEVTSTLSFPLIDERPILTVGSRTFVMSHYAGRSPNTLVFTLTTDEFARLRTGDAVMVRYGAGGPGRQWSFGRLNKAILRSE
jgi:hypothetical protein